MTINIGKKTLNVIVIIMFILTMFYDHFCKCQFICLVISLSLSLSVFLSRSYLDFYSNILFAIIIFSVQTIKISLIINRSSIHSLQV